MTNNTKKKQIWTEETPFHLDWLTTDIKEISTQRHCWYHLWPHGDALPLCGHGARWLPSETTLAQTPPSALYSHVTAVPLCTRRPCPALHLRQQPLCCNHGDEPCTLSWWLALCIWKKAVLCSWIPVVIKIPCYSDALRVIFVLHVDVVFSGLTPESYSRIMNTKILYKEVLKNLLMFQNTCICDKRHESLAQHLNCMWDCPLREVIKVDQCGQ